MDVKQRLEHGLVGQPNGCREWQGYRDPDGYGRIGDGAGKMPRTHRLAWVLANGPIPVGLHVLHHCDNPPCGETEPSEEYPEGHLFLGTNADNVADRDAKGRGGNQRKTHCIRNHEFTEANTYVYQGRRYCRTCMRASTVRRRAEKRQVVTM